MATWTKQVTMAVAASLVLLAPGCGGQGDSVTDPPQGLASCGSAPFLTVPLVPFGNIIVVSPLGNLNPPPHTFPTDHIYVYMSVTSPITAPGPSVVTSVAVQHRTGGGQAPFDDYVVTFYPCADVMLQLGHVASLATQLRAKVGALDSGCGASYQTGGFTYQQCRKDVTVTLAAGETIGTTAATLDVLARDRRVTVSYVNSTRLSDPVGEFGDKHVACPIDYFVPPIADQLRSKLGPPSQIRTTPPVCGTVAQDVPNTAAGRWFHPGSPTHPEDPHLALVHDNVVPALAAFSVGTSIRSLPTGVYTFTPVSTGRVNLDFRYVTTIGEIVCYAVSRNQRVLVQLVSASRLRVEGAGSGGCGDPSTWTLGAGAVEFDR